MPIFSYKALDVKGKKVQGLINAFNKRAASEKLGDRGYNVIDVKDKTDTLELKILTLINPIKIKDVVVFSRQFSVMISANLALVQSLKIASEQTENISLKMVISEVAHEVEGGSSLSNALGKRKNVFSQFYISVIKSGETSGRLDEVLVYLADEMEKDYDMVSKIKGAMIYPAFVMVGLTIVGAVMMVVVVPKLTGVLAETGGELPMATKIVIAISDFLAAYWWFLWIVIGGNFVGLKAFLKTNLGKSIFDLIKLKLPVFGKLSRLIYVVRFTRSMNTLISGGVTVVKSLEIVADVVGNEVYRKLIKNSQKIVGQGGTLSKAFLMSDEMPRMVPQMISIGERTGKLDLVFEKITNFYAREIDNILGNLVTLMEPIIMVIMGVAVGIMVAAIIMPMYNMANQI